jgi:hypothetical protein
MRWNKVEKKKVQAGDTKDVRKFLLLPMCLEDEWRWLEMARYRAIVHDDDDARKQRYAAIYWLNP